MMSPLRRVCLLALMTLFALASGVHAGGVRPLLFPQIPPAAGPITIDGDLRDWPGGDAVRYVPVDLDAGFRVETGGGAALRTLSETEHSAALRLCYDARALYVAIRWKGPRRGAQGGAATMHFAGERTVSLAFPWQGAGPPAPGARSVFRPDADGRGGTQEIRIPWALLTRAGKPPVGTALPWMVDLTWPDLTAALLRELPGDVRWHNTAVTYSFLTSADGIGHPEGYLPDSSRWGDLVFTDLPRPPAVLSPPMASGVSALPVARAPHPPQTPADWPAASFAQAIYAPGYLKNRYSARIAAQYDSDNLYLAAHVRAPGGPFNTQPQSARMGFAGGDCLQIRFSDGARTINLAGWYDSVGRKPALAADGSDLPHPFLLEQGARESFRPEPGGYVQQIVLPWRALGRTAPHVGERWKATFQPWWAGLEPQFTAFAESTLQPRGALTYAYTMPAEGNLTLGVFDISGHLLRWIVRGEHRRAGRSAEEWDGLDQYGKPIPAGSYQIKAIYHPPLGLDYQMTLGNPGSPPWPTADDRGDWLSDESDPQGAATDGRWVFLAAPGSEKGYSIIAVDENGRRQWGFQEDIYPRCVSLAVSGDYLYALYSGPELTSGGDYNGHNAIERAVLVCLDKRTGRPARFSAAAPQTRVATWPYREAVTPLWEMRRNKTFDAARYGGQPRYFSTDVGESTGALGVAATAGRVYLAMNYDDKLLALDAATAQKVDEIPVPKPAGLRALPDGTLLAVSGTSVVRVDPATKRVTPLIDHDLVSPHDVTTDAGGDIYVGDWGASFQVKVFSPSGKFLRAVGKAGGRPRVGPWDAGAMLVPRGLAVTDAGRLWVAEDDNAPCRVSVWDAATGAFVRDYLGPAPYGGAPPFWRDPQDPSRVFAEGVLWRVDEAHKTAVPISTPLRRMDRGQPFLPTPNGGSPVSRAFTHDGRQYLALVGNRGIVTVLRRDGDRLHPVAALGGLSRLVAGDGTVMQDWDSDLHTHSYPNWYPDFFRGHSGDNFSWTDADGDGLVQSGEMRWAPTVSRFDPLAEGRQAEWSLGWGAAVGPDGSVTFAGFTRDKEVVYRVDVSGWTPGGAPIYDIKGAHRVLLTDEPGNISGLYVTNDDKLLVSYGYEYNAPGHDALACFDRDGHELWSIPRVPPSKQGREDVLADNVIGEFTVPGLGPVVATWLWHGNYRPYLLTTDGLYVGTLLEDTRLGPAAKWDESYRYAYQSPDGTPELINGANDAYHLLRITGLTGGRFGGTLRLTAADVQAAAAARAAPPPKPAAPPPILHVAWAPKPPAIDGDLADWDMAAGVALNGSNGRTARITLARDARNLYLAYDVRGASLVNKGTNWQTLFITGDCVDLMLSTQPGVHYAPAEGDERLLLGVYQDKPVAVLYRSVVPGTRTPVPLMAARIDKIVQLPDARVAFKRGNGSYTLEAAVPLADLGLDPARTDDLRGDVGVVYADETGRSRSLRLYHYNHDTAITADLTTEATLQPGNWGPLEMPLGPNLLDNGGFETPLASNPEGGWAIGEQRNGAAARLVPGGAHSGTQSLLLEQTTPVSYPSEAYALPKYEDFQKAANGGQGGGGVNVSQTVPVTGGKRYRLRLHFRAEGLAPEKKEPGPGRGYAALEVWVSWRVPPGRPGGAVWVANEQADPEGWKTLTDARFNYYSVAVPYAAPEGATAATVSLSLVTQAAGHQPKVWVDDVEMVEAP